MVPYKDKWGGKERGPLNCASSSCLDWEKIDKIWQPPELASSSASLRHHTAKHPTATATTVQLNIMEIFAKLFRSILRIFQHFNEIHVIKITTLTAISNITLQWWGWDGLNWKLDKGDLRADGSR